jgi:transposase
MTAPIISVGVDVCKDFLDVHFFPLEKDLRVENAPAGIKAIQKELALHTVRQIVCESTAGYEKLMLQTLGKNGHKVWAVEPQRIKGFKRSEGLKHKTDASDARAIALFASQKQCTYDKKLATDDGLALSENSKRRSELTAMIEAEKKRLKNPSRFDTTKSIERHIKYLENEIERIDRNSADLIEKDAELSKKNELIQSVPGVGKITAMTLIATVPELGTIEHKQASALLGVVPYANQSGSYTGRTSIRGGRSLPRKVLFMAALSASQHNQDLKVFYQRLCKEGGKSHKAALVAVMNKLIHTINAVLHRGTSWTPTPNGGTRLQRAGSPCPGLGQNPKVDCHSPFLATHESYGLGTQSMEILT